MEDQTETMIEVPSKSRLAKATGIALVVALILLFAAVLPAEYGFDPLKTGAALGLTGISQAQVKEVKGSAPMPAPGQTGVYTPEPKIFKVDSEDFALRPGEGMESSHLNSTANRTKSLTRITLKVTNSTTRSARTPPTAPSPRLRPVFTAGSGRIAATKKSSST
jgi:hypothetical protein